MTQADSVHSTPPINTSVDDPVYLPTDITPEQLFQAIGKLRKDAREEIDRLLRFLDETENLMELEPNGDELDASYPKRGPHVLRSNSNEDDDPAENGEPSGIADLDGLLEQIGRQDWQPGGFA